MPGLHSPAKLAQRRLRAIERGYLKAHSAGPALEWQHVQVKRAVAGRVKLVAASMAMHREHMVISGSCSPFPRTATLAARPLLSQAEFKDAMRLRAASNRQRH
eukprot:6253706-Lingulodinium_polyedra.AAC.1